MISRSFLRSFLSLARSFEAQRELFDIKFEVQR